MVDRRTALGLLAAATLASRARAQQLDDTPRIGLISTSVPAYPGHALFNQRLGELGYVQGRNLRVEPRYAAGLVDKLADFAAELLRLDVQLIAAIGAVTVQAVRKVSKTIPVVFTVVLDPVEEGLVPNAQRPGGRTTGVTNFDPAQPRAQMKLIKQLVPGIESVGILGDAGVSDQLDRANVQAAHEEGLRPVSFRLKGPDEDLEAIFSTLRERRAGAVLALEVPAAGLHGNAIVQRATAARLATVFPGDGMRFNPTIAFGASLTAAAGRMADLVDKVLRGTPPGDIPVYVMTQHRLSVNQRVARAAGIAVPPELLARADAVVD